MEQELILEEMPEPTFEESIENITKMQDKWLEYYDEEGNLCDKDGNIIEPVKPTEPIDDSTDLSYLYEKEPIRTPESTKINAREY